MGFTYGVGIVRPCPYPGSCFFFLPRSLISACRLQELESKLLKGAYVEDSTGAYYRIYSGGYLEFRL